MIQYNDLNCELSKTKDCFVGSNAFIQFPCSAFYMVPEYVGNTYFSYMKGMIICSYNNEKSIIYIYSVLNMVCQYVKK